MGSSSSKKHRQPASGGNKGGPAVPVPMPVGPPYNGHPIQYQHMVINAEVDVQARFGFIQHDIQMQATNVEQYYPQLAAMYAQGYRMLVFVALPGSVKTFGLASMGRSQVKAKFQGIFRALFPEEMEQQWELRVEKSTLINQMFMNWSGNLFLRTDTQSGSTTDTSHIFQTLNNVTQAGGRLISVEVTGMAGQQVEMQRQMMSRQANMQYWRTGTMPMMQVAVDVFYDVPVKPSSERYMYQVVSCPMQSSFTMQMPYGRWTSVMDWQSVMQQYLGTGWKLVEIFEDFSTMATSQMSGLTANVTQTKNCLWIFEKPVSRLNDNTPYYEGTMAEHWFTSSTEIHGLGFGGVEMHVNTNWEPVIEQYGQQGWQVVRILSTPDTQIQGMFQPTMRTRQMIFFQRLKEGLIDVPGAPTPPAYQSATNTSSDMLHPPPSYDQLSPAPDQGDLYHTKQ
ncbi:hypothetical protein ACF0H5_013790 [Mactra antiquata]